MMNRLLLALPTVSALLTVPASLTAGSPPRAAEPLLVADLAPGDIVEDGLRIFPNPAVRLGETIFFTARSPATGFELWASDGSEAGTFVVRDRCPGPCDANPRRLTAAGNAAVYFVADAGEPRLFRSDGTRAGTLPVLGACPGGRCFSDPRILAAAGERLVFTARGADGALGLWVTDGTRPGTRPMAPPAGGCALESVDEAVTAGERVTLDARCAGGGEALWAVGGGEARERRRTAARRCGRATGQPPAPGGSPT